jgi:hypothetical protein
MEKRYKVFKWFFIILFVTFLTLYFSQLTGYYEYRNYQKMTLTKDQIEQFEQDIKEGKEVDIRDYSVNTTKNYKNNFSNTGLNLSNGISTTIKTGVIKIFGAIAGYVDE